MPCPCKNLSHVPWWYWWCLYHLQIFFYGQNRDALRRNQLILLFKLDFIQQQRNLSYWIPNSYLESHPFWSSNSLVLLKWNNNHCNRFPGRGKELWMSANFALCSVIPSLIIYMEKKFSNDNFCSLSVSFNIQVLHKFRDLKFQTQGSFLSAFLQ